jgi:nitrous oxidase accessory protein NosD
MNTQNTIRFEGTAIGITLTLTSEHNYIAAIPFIGSSITPRLNQPERVH